MCDLIDLNSPDPRRSQAISKLASPLIPGPETPAGEKIRTVDFILNYEKRPSLDNNPFDKVFKETSEYVAKKDDPFEAVLEKAQQNSDGFNSPRRCYKYNEDFNFTPKKKKRHSDILRMNKTLEEPLLQGILNKNFQLSKYQQQNPEDEGISFNPVDNNEEEDSTNTQRNVVTPHNSPKIIILPPSPADRSVLNQSAMNDTLSETSCGSAGSEENQKTTERISTSVKGGDTFPKLEMSSSEIEIELFKPSKHRRSMSQGNKFFLEPLETLPEPFRPRSKSIIDHLKVSDLLNKSRISSVSSTDTYSNGHSANNAFMETGSLTTASESFDISRISVTPRLSCNSSSSLYSCSSRNKAFLLDSQSACRNYDSASSAKSSCNLSSITRSTGTGNLLNITPLNTPVRIADLEMRFEKLKIQSMGSIGALPSYSPNHKVKSFLKSDGSQSVDGREAKLIDTQEFNVETDEISNYSSDSVFVENNNTDCSVFREAKLLARTFDELAHQSTSNSFSSGDDLLYSRPRWNFDILPASDDEEAVVDNLIELPASPLKTEPEALVYSSQKQDIGENGGKKLMESKVSEEIRDLESEFIDQDITRNKVMAATLLLDLERIVHRENNPEAITLLENLEKVLGVKYESNTQLLATCLQGTNNLSKSPKKFVNKLVLKENIRHESLERSDEDNNEDHEKSSSIKISNLNGEESLGMNLNIETPMNKSEKSVIVHISSQSEENIENENLPENSKNISNSAESEVKRMLVDQHEALKLITNLSQILGGPNNDSSPLSLLTNLGKVLNLATNQLNFENSLITKTSQNKDSDYEIPSDIDEAQKKSLPKEKHDVTKTVCKQSNDSSAKLQNTTAPRLSKRSMSFGSGQRISIPTSAAIKAKGKPHPKIFKKALSCSEVPKSDKLDKPSTAVPEMGRSRASSISGTGKYKLKKKLESENVTIKKGPLKALIPVGNMQRRGSMSTKVAPISLSRTPPKSAPTVTPSTFQSAMSSTPNPTVALVVTKKSPKTKPVASSTPDGGGSKARRMRLQFAKNNTKPKFSCNISPVTPLPAHSITGSASSRGSAKNHRQNKTLSPPKKRSSGEALTLNTTESSIPKFSPMSGFSRRNSRESIKNLENSGSPKTSSIKTQTPKKSQFHHNNGESQIPQSPLKTMNSQNSKFKPFNLISKLRRGSNGSNVPDKENCA